MLISCYLVMSGGDRPPEMSAIGVKLQPGLAVNSEQNNTL